MKRGSTVPSVEGGGAKGGRTRVTSNTHTINGKPTLENEFTAICRHCRSSFEQLKMVYYLGELASGKYRRNSLNVTS